MTESLLTTFNASNPEDCRLISYLYENIVPMYLGPHSMETSDHISGPTVCNFLSCCIPLSQSDGRFSLFFLSLSNVRLRKKGRTNYFFLRLSIKYHRMCDHLERISQCYSVACLEEVLLALEPAISQSYCEISFRRGIMMPKEKKTLSFLDKQKTVSGFFPFSLIKKVVWGSELV